MTSVPGWISSLTVAIALLGLACQRDAGAAPAPSRARPARSAAPSPPPPSGSTALAELEARRITLRKSFRSAQGAARGAVRKQAARTLEQALIDAVLPRWDGTAWDFSGTSTTPGSGAIACGYFVSTTLGEAGLHVERAALAQQPSEDIIKTLAPPAAIERFSDFPVADFTAAVARRGDGLYVLGLDNHTGFLVVKAGEVLFHHSSYVAPQKVVRERASTSSPIVTSRYRVIGKLFTDDALIDAWLEGTPM